MSYVVLVYFIVQIDLLVVLGDNVSVGVYSVIGLDVEIGVGIMIGLYVVIEGLICIGCDNCISQFVLFGGVLQDKKFKGECIELVIGDCNLICEFVIINCGIGDGGGIIYIGNDNWLLVYVYVVYDCQIGNYVVFFNYLVLVGYVEIGDWIILLGYLGVYQFCKVGVYVFIGMGCLVGLDVLLFVMMVNEICGCLCGINSEGFKCCGFDVICILVIKCVYCMLYMVGLSQVEVCEQFVVQVQESEDVCVMFEFFDCSECVLVC